MSNVASNVALLLLSATQAEFTLIPEVTSGEGGGGGRGSCFRRKFLCGFQSVIQLQGAGVMVMLDCVK
jgi:hypothetical protein